MKKVTLYKYVSLVTNKDGKNYSLDIIKNNELYFAKREDLNDPFEMIKPDNSFVEGARVISLTNSYRKKLMWSHYANGHKGICLTIEVNEEDVIPVIYTTRNNMKNKKISTFTNGKKKANISFKFFENDLDYTLVKDRKWFYEKEYRIVKNKDNCIEKDNNYYFNKFKITNIYLGASIDENSEEYKKLIELLKSKKIKYSKMMISKNDYSLIIKKQLTS